MEYIRTGKEEIVAKINEITLYQIGLMLPHSFDSSNPDNFLKGVELSFESVCTNLEEMGVTNPKRLTVFEFYSKIRYFKNKNKPK